MLKRFANSLIKNLGRENYMIDSGIKSRDIFIIMVEKFFCYLRGFLLKFFVRKSDGPVFVGRRCKIRHKRLISFGGTVNIGDNVEINALSRNGIVFRNNVSILRNSIIECTGVIRNLGEGLVIGNNVGIAQNCFIQVRGFVTIGDNVIFGPGVSIFSENHVFEDPELPVSGQGESRKGVIIEDGVWIGANSTILDGITIGRNSVVAAGSIVNKDVPPFTIVGGVPARILKERKKIT